MRINDKETLALADAVRGVMGENAKDYKPNRGGKGHDDFIDLHSIDKEKRRGSSPLTEKDIEEANEFTKAAAKAAVAGDDEFEFDGKTYPSEMDVDVAKKILGESVSVNEAKMSPEDAKIAQEIIRSEDEKVSVAYGQKLKVARQKLIKKYGKGWAKMVESINEAIDFSGARDGQLKAWLDRFRSVKGNPWDGFKDDLKAAEKEAKKRGLKESTDLDEAKGFPESSQGAKSAYDAVVKLSASLRKGSNLNKAVNNRLGGNYDTDFVKMEKAIAVIFDILEEIDREYQGFDEAADLDESIDDIVKKVKQLKVGDNTNFGVVMAISNKSITFKAKDTPKTEIEFKQRKMGSRDFILDKLVKLTPDGKGVAKESAELEEAKMWTVTITKKAGKLSKGQTVNVKANNTAQAIKKGLAQMKVDPMLVPSDAIDVTLVEELEEASNADLKKVLDTAKKIGGRVKGNTADFGMGAVIDFSIEKGKIKFDGGKSSGVEYFDDVKDAIASLTAGLD